MISVIENIEDKVLSQGLGNSKKESMEQIYSKNTIKIKGENVSVSGEAGKSHALPKDQMATKAKNPKNIMGFLRKK